MLREQAHRRDHFFCRSNQFRYITTGGEKAGQNFSDLLIAGS
jgi:hypothetical protein